MTYFPPGGGLLPPNTTSFDDPAPGEIGCYFTSVSGGDPLGTVSYGTSDVICLFRGQASGATPSNFKAQLDGGQTTLSWTAPTSPTGHTLLIIRTDGSPLDSRVLGVGVASTTHDTAGAIVCYQLRPLGVAGQSDILCSIPHASTLSAAGAPPRGLFDRLRGGLDLAGQRASPTIP